MAEGIVSGSAASISSSVALAICGKRELDDCAAPINGPSQWVLGKSAPYHDGFSLQHTLIGYLIHHAMSVCWAVLFEKFRGSPREGSWANKTLWPAAATAATACFVDFQLTPQRLTPGFEKRLSRRSLALVYVAFALGLAGATVLKDRSEH